MKRDEALWEALDEAIFGEGTTRQERARQFAALMDEAVARGAVRGDGCGTLGGRLRELRQGLKLTPTRASRKAGVDGSAWRAWEADVRIPSGADLARVAGVLGRDLWAELHRLRRRAPAACLGQALAAPPMFSVARTAGRAGDEGEALRLEVRNLDPLVRDGLSRWCLEVAGSGSEEAMARALSEARELSEADRERWVRAVVARVELPEA